MGRKIVIGYCLTLPFLILIGCDDQSEFREDPSIVVPETSIYFDHVTDQKTIYLYNTGNVPLEWFLTSPASYVEFLPETGLLLEGDSVDVDLVISKDNLEQQDHFTTISLQTDLTSPVELSLQVFHYLEEKWLLPVEITDAEYDRNNDVIVAVSNRTNQLVILDPRAQTVDPVELGIPPKCVSVSQDGKYAAVGHNAVITYIDLESLEVINQRGLTSDIFDIVMGPDQWVYVFPAEGQWVSIYSINMVTQEERKSGRNIYEDTKARLHPSGKYIYGAGTRLSPSDFEKYDISTGIAQYLYDSPYHGDYRFDGDIWLSDNGNYLYARSGNIFKSSETKGEDIIYIQALPGDYQFKFIDHSTQAERVYGLLSNSVGYQEGTLGNRVAMYDLGFNLRQVVELPKFLIGDRPNYEIVGSNGHFGFFNRRGSFFYALVKATYEGPDQWAVVAIPVK